MVGKTDFVTEILSESLVVLTQPIENTSNEVNDRSLQVFYGNVDDSMTYYRWQFSMLVKELGYWCCVKLYGPIALVV